VDGKLAQFGPITDGLLTQTKGVFYSLVDLVGESMAAEFLEGYFLTLYLSPADYHRIHAPVAGTVRRFSYFSGQLWPVNEIGIRHVAGLFSVNERLITPLESPAGLVAVIKVGAATETAMKEKKARVEDALNATRAAVEEGIVAGGGVALLRASTVIESLKLEGDEKVGAMIVKRALEEPIRRIVENAGLEGSVIVEKVKAEKVATRGFDAESLQFVDMIQAGIIDPTKVERVALQNAASVASLLLTTEALVTDLPEEKPVAGPPMPQGDF